ncbi:MAG TPA: helix-turn-helix domain-containing protein [Tianweitania sediminis]|jgi:DNA-binding transcriptional MerR regulator|nr:helix-turn-helix domain-containing protein [Tianweitania sediminis]
MSNLSIGELSRRTKVKVPTVRYYEDVGLMPAPPRSEGKQRRYDADAVSRLNFIRHARELGFEVNAIRELLDLSADRYRPCEEIDAIASRHLSDVTRRIAQLQMLEKELQRMVQQCGHGSVEDCRVIETLNDHAHCSPDAHPIGLSPRDRAGSP